jgi:hypothetical protein
MMASEQIGLKRVAGWELAQQRLSPSTKQASGVLEYLLRAEDIVSDADDGIKKSLAGGVLDPNAGASVAEGLFNLGDSFGSFQELPIPDNVAFAENALPIVRGIIKFFRKPYKLSIDVLTGAATFIGLFTHHSFFSTIALLLEMVNDTVKFIKQLPGGSILPLLQPLLAPGLQSIYQSSVRDKYGR